MPKRHVGEPVWGSLRGSFSFDHTKFSMILFLSKKAVWLEWKPGFEYGSRQLLCSKIWSNLYNKVRQISSYQSVWICVLDSRLRTLLLAAVHRRFTQCVFWLYLSCNLIFEKTLSQVEYPAYRWTTCEKISFNKLTRRPSVRAVSVLIPGYETRCYQGFLLSVNSASVGWLVGELGFSFFL